jgi:hypothetical protein
MMETPEEGSPYLEGERPPSPRGQAKNWPMSV